MPCRTEHEETSLDNGPKRFAIMHAYTTNDLCFHYTRILAIVVAIGTATMQYTCAQPFSTVINLPGDTPPDSLDSDTQLNVLDQGFLEIVSEVFHVGNPDGSSTNAELNLSDGGRILTRGFLSGLRVQSGGRLNITGGNYQADLGAQAGSHVEISGGLIAGERPSFDAKDVVARDGSNLIITGGEILSDVNADDGSTLEITGGGLNLLEIREGANVTQSGGIVNRLSTRDNGSFTLKGGEFRRNGMPISGLESLGNSGQIQLPLANGETLSGTLADGTPFLLFEPRDGFELSRGTINLETVAVPTSAPNVFKASDGAFPQGLRAGQTLIVDDDLGFSQIAAGPGSQVDFVAGGSLTRFKAYGASVNVSGGMPLDTQFERFEVFDTKTQMTDGILSRPTFNFGSELTMTGGEIASASINYESNAIVEGGAIGNLDIFNGSSAEVNAGMITQLTVDSEGSVRIRGGDIQRLGAGEGASVRFIGTEFSVNGGSIRGLRQGRLFEFADRSVTLSGVLADGSPFSYFLDPFRGRVTERFDFDATLEILLVPEPGSTTLVGLALSCVGIVGRRRVHR